MLKLHNWLITLTARQHYTKKTNLCTDTVRMKLMIVLAIPDEWVKQSENLTVRYSILQWCIDSKLTLCHWRVHSYNEIINPVYDNWWFHLDGLKQCQSWTSITPYCNFVLNGNIVSNRDIDMQTHMKESNL